MHAVIAHIHTHREVDADLHYQGTVESVWLCVWGGEGPTCRIEQPWIQTTDWKQRCRHPESALLTCPEDSDTHLTHNTHVNPLQSHKYSRLFRDKLGNYFKARVSFLVKYILPSRQNTASNRTLCVHVRVHRVKLL